MYGIRWWYDAERLEGEMRQCGATVLQPPTLGCSVKGSSSCVVWVAIDKQNFGYENGRWVLVQFRLEEGEDHEAVKEAMIEVCKIKFNHVLKGMT